MLACKQTPLRHFRYITDMAFTEVHFIFACFSVWTYFFALMHSKYEVFSREICDLGHPLRFEPPLNNCRLYKVQALTHFCIVYDLWDPEMFGQGIKWNSRPPQRLSSQYTDKSMKPKTQSESPGPGRHWEDEWSTNYDTNKTRCNTIQRGAKDVQLPTLTVMLVLGFRSRGAVSSELKIAVNNLDKKGTQCTQIWKKDISDRKHFMWALMQFYPWKDLIVKGNYYIQQVASTWLVRAVQTEWPEMRRVQQHKVTTKKVTRVWSPRVTEWLQGFQAALLYIFPSCCFSKWWSLTSHRESQCSRWLYNRLV